MLDIALDTYLKTFHLAVTFQAEMGQTTVLLGESGAGKSTVLRILAGLLHPQQGHITLDGVTYYDSARRIVVPPQERPFGYVFQDYVLFPHLTIFENIAFGLRAQGQHGKTIEKRVAQVLEQVNLASLGQRYPAQLSGGQQQRVALARALVLQPQLLLLDEPLAALDVQTRREVRQELRHILATTGITTLMVTHQYLDALLFGEQILVVDQGQIVQQGGQRELREYPRSSYVAELVGVNFFRGHIVNLEANTTCVIQVDMQDTHGDHRAHDARVEVVATLTEQATDAAQVDAPAMGLEAFVIVDPRSITLHHEIPEGSARNIFRGTITHILQQGGIAGDKDDHLRVSIMLNSSTPPLIAEITAASATHMQLREGEGIYATFKATEALAYV
ncbi:MAG: ABC transporter ATP-binding protein [Ktedonobacteraceae bacterium]